MWCLLWVTLVASYFALVTLPTYAEGEHARSAFTRKKAVLSNGWLEVVELDSARMLSSRRLSDAGECSVLSPSGDRGVLVSGGQGSGRLAAFAYADCRELWSVALPANEELVWGPEVVRPESGADLLVGVMQSAVGNSSSRLVAWSMADGSECLASVLPGAWQLTRVADCRVLVVCDGGSGAQGDSLVVFDLGTRRQLSLFKAVGQVTDYVAMASGNRVFYAEKRGTGANEGWCVCCRDGLSGASLWARPLLGGVSALKACADGVCLGRTCQLGEADGVVWSVLSGQSGEVVVESEPLNGVLLDSVVRDGESWLLLSSVISVPALDKWGRVIRDIRSGEAQEKAVEGCRLYRITSGQTALMYARPYMAAVRNEASDAYLLDVAGRLLLSGRRQAPQRVGERLASQPQMCLVALDCEGRACRPDACADDAAWGEESWSWQGVPLEADLRELGEGVLASERGQSWLTGGEETRLHLLVPENGREVWVSRWLSGKLDELAGGEKASLGDIWLVSSASMVYGLNGVTGEVLRELNCVPVLNWSKWNNFVGVLLLSACVAWYVFRARNEKLFIRRIAGLAAIEEAVGRATEMGKPVMYVPGIADVDDIQTLASLSILTHVARSSAEYDTPVMVPNCRSVVMSMAADVVQDAYTRAGRPESFQRDYVCYLSDEQFGFAAGVSGIMVRERPAAIFYMGTFLAEALILAETGNATGAIQIAGSATASQLPFFVAACDYTLIGEELYAASAYLSRDAMQVGSLKGQDAGKAVIMVLVLVGSVLLSFGFTFVMEWCTPG